MRRYLAVLLLLAGCSISEPNRPEPPATDPAHDLVTAVYPVVLLSGDRVLCVCKSPAELRHRTEREVDALNARARVLDAAGTEFAVVKATRRKGPRGQLRTLITTFLNTNSDEEADFFISPAPRPRNNAMWDALSNHHDHFRYCGVKKDLTPLQLIGALRNPKCVYPPF